MKQVFRTVPVLLLCALLQSQTGYRDAIVGGMTCVIVQHEVQDYAKWKPLYEKDKNRREKSGIQDVLLLRGEQNKNLITAIFGLDDYNQAKSFFEDPGTAKLMGSAGVIGRPSFTYFKVEGSGLPVGDAFLLVKHKVQDYDQWEKAFYDHETTREAFNIRLTAVGRDLENPENSIVILNSKTSDNFTSFMEESDLKEVMQLAGVISEPIIQYMASNK